VNDTQRLDAIGEYGLCVATHDTLSNTGWDRVWVVTYQDKALLAPTIREAIDGAVLDLTSMGLAKQ
jgi:hypothetical protein